MFAITEHKRAEKDLNAALVEIRGLKERLEEENLDLREEIFEVKGFDEIVGKSDALRYVLTRVEQVAKTDATVLLQGETGVGKELIARAIHERSSRSNGPQVKVNCATLPEALVESELFGHEKGAFTGADRQRKGRFELADGGTILLDEVGELPPSTQASYCGCFRKASLSGSAVPPRSRSASGSSPQPTENYTTRFRRAGSGKIFFIGSMSTPLPFPHSASKGKTFLC